ncbi:PIN domain-containing protein [Porcincola intestinalis]|uniref:PIN-like domain-containing protein n=1 Tax=Porcincola intestinalis TaxID=2606632 RepID=A0A6L5X467_9FIRM|nr:PIN domain-containing protein [Porcincola intestinalis]MCI6768149.1 PIN domain-containing protein [Lachnospiraceae bacterium]MDD7060610.1 PIN domain-containing protein [Porcincola intestinalis]MDY5283954.1 PIN domain-containing protein [Porcincola intestinalis]MDY5578957.1 PIN domain-containing protein [Porcincola intestinalis]MSS15189.1 hypothetical protein [Porcincola intestinalis]
MNIYYIDYENVNSFGLKGAQLLGADSKIYILYSKKADNVKIDVLTELMKSKAEIHFLPVHVGTPNALDFQLITLLFLGYQNENHYYIISKDSGYDCCIRTAQECGAPNVRRFKDIESSLVRQTPTQGSSPQDVSEVRSVSLPQPASDAASTAESAEDAVNGTDEALADGCSPAETVSFAILPEEIAFTDPGQPVPSENSLDSSGQITSSNEISSRHSRRKRRSRKSSASRAQKGQEERPEKVTADSEPFADSSADRRLPPVQSSPKAEQPSPKIHDSFQPGSQSRPEQEPETLSENVQIIPDSVRQAEPTVNAESPENKKPAQRPEHPAPVQVPVKAGRSEKAQSAAHEEHSAQPESASQEGGPSQAGSCRYPSSRITEVLNRKCSFSPDEKQLSIIRDVLMKARNKQQFYTLIVRKCGQKNGLALYHTIRCAYNDLLSIEG